MSKQSVVYAANMQIETAVHIVGHCGRSIKDITEAINNVTGEVDDAEWYAIAYGSRSASSKIADAVKATQRMLERLQYAEREALIAEAYIRACEEACAE